MQDEREKQPEKKFIDKTTYVDNTIKAWKERKVAGNIIIHFPGDGTIRKYEEHIVH